MHRLRYEYGQSLQAKDVNISILSLRTENKNSAREKKTGCSVFPIRLVQFFVRFFLVCTKSGIFNVHDIDAACLVVVAIVNMCDSVNMCDFVMLNKFEVNKMLD